MLWVLTVVPQHTAPHNLSSPPCKQPQDRRALQRQVAPYQRRRRGDALLQQNRHYTSFMQFVA